MYKINCVDYTVVVHGNGWAYEIFEDNTGKSAWFQDSDAEEIQKATNNFENELVIEDYFSVLE